MAKNGQVPTKLIDGENLKRDIKAYKYSECSAKTQKGLKNCFDEAVRAVLYKKSSSNGSVSLSGVCILL
jgi:GTPase SAR1 family protein